MTSRHSLAQSPLRRLVGLAAALLAAAPLAGPLGGCTPGTGPDDEGLTYYADAKPVIDQNCVSCHQAGGGAPFALDTYEAVTAMQGAIVDAVESGRMPPWLPDPDCRRYPGERVMSDDDKAVLLAWADEGGAEGDVSQAREVDIPSVILENPSLELRTREAYLPNQGQPDDYRCMLLDHEFASDTWISGYQVVPDQTAIVHHVLIYVVPPDSLPEFGTFDDAEPGEGFTCFSDPGVESMMIGTWVPGSPATTLPNNLGFPVPAGSRVGIQVHYNLLGGAPAADHTAVELKLLDVRPAYEAQNLFLVEDDFMVPAGASQHTVSREFENDFFFPVTVISVLPHMHLLGQSIRMDHVKANGEESCIVDIPRWDFNWQQTYDLDPDHFVVVEPGESTRVTCTWDNSEQNQPIVNGVRAEPRNVTWGEGTLDEMCIVIVTAVADRL